MARFIAFVDDPDDLHEYGRDFPEHEFVFVSFQRLGPKAVVIDANDTSGLLERLGTDHRRDPFSGMVFGSMPELYVGLAASTAAALGLPRFLAHAQAARDKYEMRRRLAAFTRSPAVHLLRSPGDALHLDGLTFPCVLKPRHGYGSMCVVKVEDAAELARMYRRLQAVLRIMSRSNPLAMPSSDMLVEPFLEGSEHTVEMFFVAARPIIEIVSDKDPMTPPYFIEVGDIMPSCLPSGHRDAVLQAARDAARAMGVERGWTHVEIKLHDGVATVVEIAARNGGGYTRAFVQLAYGIDMRRVLIDSYLDVPLPRPPVAANTVVGTIVVAYGLTLVLAAKGLDRWRCQPSFREVTQRLTRWTPRLFIGPPCSFDNTVMSYFVFHPSRERARALSREAAASIRLLTVAVTMKSTLAHAIFLFALRVRSRRRRGAWAGAAEAVT